MATEWTDAQKDAIDREAKGILVSAAAGSGKTAVLVEHIIRMIKGGCDVSELLVSTFTKAAAASMKEKIYNALYTEHLRDPKNAHIRRQLTMVYGADIGTIHSFCSRLIRSCFFEAGVPADFRLASDDEARIMRTRVMSRTLDEMFEEGGEDFLRAGEMFVRKNSDKRFSELILSIYDKLVALPFYDEALSDAQRACDIPDGGFSDTPFARELLSSLRATAEAYLDIYESLSGAYENTEKYGSLFSWEKALLSSFTKDGLSWDEAYERLHGIAFPAFPRKQKKDDEIFHYRYKDVRDAMKKDLERMRDSVFTDTDASVSSDMRGMLPAVRGLCGTVRAFVKNYTAEKESAGILDFNDLEQITVSLLWERGEDGTLRETELAKTVSARYSQIFIDEYQDLNTIQELIFRALSKNDGENLFMVGDVKQSIYGFRQANPRIFLEKYGRFSKEKDAGENALILLSTNFRSRTPVLDSVNAVFSEIMSAYAGELDYTEDEYLNENQLYPESDERFTTELYLIKRKKKKDSEETDAPAEEDTQGEELSKSEEEARLAANLIRSMTAEGFPIFNVKAKTSRPVRYGDFAILLRSINPRAAVFEKALIEAGIPVSTQSKEDFFSDPDVLLVTSLLRTVDDPLKDIPLAAVMRSPVFGFTDDEIMEIRFIKRSAPLYEAVKTAAGAGDKKCADMLSYIERARLMSRDMSAPEFLSYLYESTMIKAILGGLPGGETRINKLDTLLSVAADYERSHYRGLFNFILYIDYLIDNKIEVSPKRTPGESDNAVKIMSIHKSKGLEFPICIVADLDKRFNSEDLREPVLYDRELGFGCDFFDSERLIVYPTAAKTAITQKMKRRAIAEEMRVLYVAMTRAQEKLILIGTCGDIDDKLKKIKASAVGNSGYFTLKSSSYLDFLLRGFKIYTVVMPLPGERARLSLPSGELLLTVLENGGEAAWEPPAKDVKKEGAGEEDAALIRDRLSFKYAFSQYAAIPSKLSATEIKGRLMEVPEPYGQPEYIKPPTRLRVPDFYKKKSGEEDAALERGTAMHLFMELCDFEETDSPEKLRAQTDGFVSSGRMTERQAEMLDYAMLWRFFETPLFMRMKRAKRLYREKRFFLSADAADFYSVPPGGAGIMVQGVIDCFFEDESGECVLIDFKTDRTDDEAKLKARYGGQLDIYRRAISEVFGRRCREVYIYSFYTGKLISFEA